MEAKLRIERLRQNVSGGREGKEEQSAKGPQGRDGHVHYCCKRIYQEA